MRPNLHEQREIAGFRLGVVGLSFKSVMPLLHQNILQEYR